MTATADASTSGPVINIVEGRYIVRDNGYTPIPVRCVTKAPAIAGWQKIDPHPTDTMIAGWTRDVRIRQAKLTGILTKYVPTIDIDIFDPEAAWAVQQFLLDKFGNDGRVLMRTGRPPKFATPFKTETPFPKILVKLTKGDPQAKDEPNERVELLADGQQVVISGIHPGTGKPYTWANGASPLTVKREELPPIDVDGAARLVADVVEALARFGYGRWAGVPKTAGNGRCGAWASDAELIDDNCLAAEAFRLVRAGMAAGAAVNMLEIRCAKAAAAETDPERKERWSRRLRKRHIAGMVESAVAKIGGAQ